MLHCLCFNQGLGQTHPRTICGSEINIVIKGRLLRWEERKDGMWGRCQKTGSLCGTYSIRLSPLLYIWCDCSLGMYAWLHSRVGLGVIDGITCAPMRCSHNGAFQEAKGNFVWAPSWECLSFLLNLLGCKVEREKRLYLKGSAFKYHRVSF
jgi:hypothetical protein